MHFSGKISSAILTYLEDRGEDLGQLYELSPLPLEMMRDTSMWVSAPDLENFLEKIVYQLSQSGRVRAEESLIAAGHEGSKYRPWGVLDSVLRMMPRPQEVFQQPDRFLSYFISPAPPIENLRRDESTLEFDLPLMAEQYPLVTTYLKAAIEGIPRYVGQELAQCEWTNIHLKIEWPQASQENFLENEAHQVSPQLLQNVVEELQKSQRELEEKNRELQRKNEDLIEMQRFISVPSKVDAKLQLEGYLTPLGSEFSSENEWPGQKAHQLGQNLARLHDYMVRAQQIITILSASNSNASALKEVSRRLDWENVKLHYPRVISDSVETLRTLQKFFQESGVKNKQSTQLMNQLNGSNLEPVKEKEFPHV